MSNSVNIDSQRVFHYFSEICKIPHGSGDTSKIADFCENFAKEHNLTCIRDEADNVIIFKDGTKGYEGSAPVILQGHTDMVCQKEDGYEIDFLNEGLETYIDGDFITAKGTTLGGDDGIAVAMVLAILESDAYSHPPIEAVFTTDEEVGMLGAIALDTSVLKGSRMINIDSEEDDVVTVSCAGGSDFEVTLPLNRVKKAGDRVDVTLKGLQGGHSGVEIHKGRVNANILAGRFLNHLLLSGVSFELISVNGGDKRNAITNVCTIELLTEDEEALISEVTSYLNSVKEELSAREKDFAPVIESKGFAHSMVFSQSNKKDIIFSLASTPYGVIDMSAEIEGLVETSLNLGILKTEEDSVCLEYSFRSNKAGAMNCLREKMMAFYSKIDCKKNSNGEYPSWEYNSDSPIRDVYVECYKEHFGKAPQIAAIHAGLECGVFASKIKNFDCISVGPAMFDIHTFKERLSISSTENIFEIIIKTLEKCK